ncbi:MAG TPA: hypothetical protein VNN73_12620, partial [Blastocatellia bacterium]|nr:hypothetical protein [Blastocatellia bacterium]
MLKYLSGIVVCDRSFMLMPSIKSRLLAALIAIAFIPCGRTGAGNPPRASTDAAPANVSRARLYKAARDGGDYLIRMQKEDGSFHYSYDAVRDRVSSRAYNIVRHAGAAFSLLELYETTGEIRYRDSARRAIDYLKTRFRPARKHNSIYVIDNDGKAKLGANGLALVALAKQIELDPKSSDRRSAERVANLILAMQNRDGSFDSYYPIRGDEPRGSVSLYYPGEAILGLVQLYRINHDRRLIGAAQRGADFLIDSERKMSALPPDAWLMQALEALFWIKPERRYAEHAIALAEAMMAEQYAAGAPAHFVGGFGPDEPR